MEHGNLIHDLGIVVAGAAMASVVFKRLGIPVIFGYLLAGLLLGPHLLPESPLSASGTVEELSQLGVVFLLFFMGMEFNLGRLQKVFAPALMAVVPQTVAMIYLAKLVGPLLGWSALSSLFFGSLLAISSSMVTIRVLSEQKRMKLPHAQLAIGILIMEDVLAVILLVILSGIAVTQQFDWGGVTLVTFLMGVFVIGVFFFGRLVVPRLLAFADKWDNKEQMTLISVGMVLGIGALALELRFSEALGAFIAGAILSQTRLVHDITESNRALHDLFTAVFFVSVGMLIDPHLVLENIGWILLFSVLTVTGKIVTCFVGLFLSGQPTRSAYRASVAKAQIGEFSFVIAELGRQLGVTDDRLTSIAFGVAFMTILLTPLITRTSEEQHNWLAGRTPGSVARFSTFYRNYLETVLTVLGRNMLLRLLKRPLIQITFYFFLICGLVLGSAYAAEWASKLDVPHAAYYGLGIWMLSAVVVVPFAIAIIRNVTAIVFMVTEALFATRGSRPIMQGRLGNLINHVATLLLVVALGGLFLAAMASYLPPGGALVLFGALVVLVALLYWRQMVRVNSRIESLFLDSFSEEAHEVEEHRREAVLTRISTEYPWPVHIREVDLGQRSAVCGKRILDLKLRQETGSMIIALARGGTHIFDPSPETVLVAEDHVVLLGTPEANAQAVSMLERTATGPRTVRNATFEIERVLLPPSCELDGNTLAGANVRRRFGVSIIGIQRGARQITAPPAEEILRAGDVLLYVGDPQKGAAFREFAERSATATAR